MIKYYYIIDSCGEQRVYGPLAFKTITYAHAYAFDLDDQSKRRAGLNLKAKTLTDKR